jgi:hypothetical protein
MVFGGTFYGPMQIAVEEFEKVCFTDAYIRSASLEPAGYDTSEGALLYGSYEEVIALVMQGFFYS